MKLKKLNTFEREEVVTKGFLEDFLNATLEERDYVTKDYLERTLDIRFAAQDSKFEKRFEQMEERIEALMEHQLHQLQTIIEGLDSRYVLRRELRM